MIGRSLRLSWLKLSPCVSQPPLRSADRGGEVDRDEPHAGLDQAAGQQAALAVGRPAVIVAQSLRLEREVERLLDPRRGQHGQGPVVEGVDPLRRVGPAQQIGLGIDQLLQAAAVVEPGQRQPGGEGELGKPEVGAVRVLAHEERVKPLAQEAGVLPRRDAAVAEHVGKRNEAGNRRVLDGREPGDRAAVGGVKLLGVAEADVVQRRGVAGQAVVGGRVVVPHRVMDRADLGELVQDGRPPRQVLGDRQAGLARGDRLELAADAIGSLRLHVERVDVRGPAELVQEDDVPGAGTRAARLARRPGAARRDSARRTPPCPPGARRVARTARRLESRGIRGSSAGRPHLSGGGGIPCC